jgi:predicted peroxiredoxin
MTERFVSAAEMMSRVLGMPGYAFAVIDHPVSSATDEQLRDRARQAIEQGLKMLVKDQGT